MEFNTLVESDNLTQFNQEIAQNPDNYRAIAHRGEAYRLLANYEQALTDFNRAIELKPDYIWAIAHRGETYYLLKRYQDAFTDFNRVVALHPNYYWAIAHRGASHHRLNRYDLALVDFNRAIELKPDYVWAILYRAQIYSLMKDYQSALVNLDRAIALDSTIIPSWHGERGLLLSYLGRYVEAIECCQQGLAEKPNDYITLYTLVVVKARWQGLEKTRPEIAQTRQVLQAVENGLAQASVLYRLGGLAALEGDREPALNYLAQAIALESEPLELARRDIAWIDLYADPQFQSLIANVTNM